MEYKIFRDKFNFNRDDSNFNLALQKNEEEDDLIEALFSNKVISDFMKDDINNPPKKTEIKKEDEFPISKKIGPSYDDDKKSQTSEQLSEASVEEFRARQKKGKTMEGFATDINKTKNIDDFIQENPELKKQYDNLNKYYDFALKSLKYLIPKFVDGKEEETRIKLLIIENEQDISESRYIERTTMRINNLIAETVI